MLSRTAKHECPGFILYSLGPNQQDDNGTPKPTGNKVTGNEPYDIVWKCAR